MDRKRWIQRTLDLQAVPAPTFEEHERAAALRKEFEHAGGLELHSDEVGNLLARVPGGAGPALAVSAHLDSVFPRGTDLASRRTAQRLHGPGIGDNAVALAALVELALDFKQDPPPGDLWLVANVCEEGLGNLRGMRQVVARLNGAVRAYLVLEGMALGQVYHRALPARRFRLSAEGPGGHSWIHAGRASALHQLIRLGAELADLPTSSEPKSTLNIGLMRGGHSVNSIADQAYLEVDLRCESEAGLQALADQVAGLVARSAVDGVKFSLVPTGARPAGGLAADHPLVQAAVSALGRGSRRRARLAAGSTDASVPLQQAYPAVCIGLTTGGEAHTVREYIDIPPMEGGYRSLLNLIQAAFAMDGD
jgi:acetylornithine deacetylase/succinyl-diaminopimelate desuccinylase-like protein